MILNIQDAIQLFDEYQYQEAFEAFVAVYTESNNLEERQSIIKILMEAYYAPNAQQLQEMYESNIQILMAYPYFWNKTFQNFSDLSFLLFPIDDDLFYIFDKHTQTFTAKYDGISDQHMKHFFSDLEHALVVRNEDSLYNLKFLFDTVRRSEDVALDNHIYLLYDAWEPLERMMQIGNLKNILRFEKFVFLMEETNHAKYPIDFKEQYGIDYINMPQKALQIEDMNRICYWWKRGYAGGILGTGVLGANDYVSMKWGWQFHQHTKFQGQPLFSTQHFYEWISDINKMYSISDIAHLYQDPMYEWYFPDFDDFFGFIKKYDETRSYTLPELFRLFFIFHYNKNHPSKSLRVAPIILWEPHLNDQTAYLPIVKTFDYKIILNSMREPLTLTTRIFESEQSIFPYSEYAICMNVPEELQKNYYAYRFEDLKAYPQQTTKAICHVLNIPFDAKMLDVDVPYESPNTTTPNEVVKGFDCAPLHRKLDYVLSEFDQVRLKIFYDPILRHYGYSNTFDFTECPMTDEDIHYLLKFPFRFEALFVALQKEDVTAQEIREILYKNMVTLLTMSKSGELHFPTVIRIHTEDI